MGPTTEIFPHTNLREVLEAPERENAEGFVLWDPDTDERVKVKYESYLALHKLLSNCTPKNIWGILSSGEDPEMAYMAAPDEFLGLVKETVATLNKQHAQIKTVATQSYTGLKGALDKEYGSKQWGRKEFAMKAVKNPHRAFLFRLLDEGSIDDMIWNMIKPSGEEPLRKVD
jgi:RNA ligase